ncbi:MAG: hypothetical protein U5L03_15925 [Burkholderiaceae bacterium]|nr:hypothetical protein [Burkholderiaceae bacterium]
MAAFHVPAAVAQPDPAVTVERGRSTLAAADIRTLEQALARLACENDGRSPESLADPGATRIDPCGGPYPCRNAALSQADIVRVRYDRLADPAEAF